MLHDDRDAAPDQDVGFPAIHRDDVRLCEDFCLAFGDQCIEICLKEEGVGMPTRRTSIGDPGVSIRDRDVPASFFNVSDLGISITVVLDISILIKDIVLFCPAVTVIVRTPREAFEIPVEPQLFSGTFIDGDDFCLHLHLLFRDIHTTEERLCLHELGRCPAHEHGIRRLIIRHLAFGYHVRQAFGGFLRIRIGKTVRLGKDAGLFLRYCGKNNERTSLFPSGKSTGRHDGCHRFFRRHIIQTGRDSLLHVRR